VSAGAVFQEALRILRSLELPEVAERDAVASMEAARPGPLQLLYEAGFDAGLARSTLLTRSAACFFAYAGGSVADDLADGDCTYLEEPLKNGPCAVFLLENLFFGVMARTGVPAEVMSTATLDLVRAAARQHIEVRTRQWTAPVFQEVAEIGAGRPFVSWLRMLWHGTPLVERAEAVGLNVGILAQTGEDIRSSDPRFTTLSPPDQETVRAWARRAADALRTEHLPWVEAVLRGIDPLLRSP
jgi:hypothetical protein